MKYLYILAIMLLAGCASTIKTQDVITTIVKASCGTCNFEMTSDACELAVKIEGKHYFVEGSSIDEHDDAHGSVGLCSMVRDAKVVGEIKYGVFVAEKFELIELN
ncbi:MAG: DUF6370 family protein [Crocinitomicaceae bacterium]|nr:DUF6370 family protein [Crocinitomicaceae bacterium]